MPYLIFGFLLLAVVILLIRAFLAADPAQLGRFLRWFLASFVALGAVTLIVMLLVSERIGLAVLLMIGLGFLFLRFWRSPPAGTGTGPSAAAQGQTTEVETSYLRMRLDHGTGAMSGTVKRGDFAGQRLDELLEVDLFALWRECRISDEASARLLESYLDRLRPDWREAAAGPKKGAEENPAPVGDAMTRNEAFAILGLVPGASDSQIKDAHHHLMMKLHPDHGGSTYLAAKINRAKEILLGA